MPGKPDSFQASGKFVTAVALNGSQTDGGAASLGRLFRRIANRTCRLLRAYSTHILDKDDTIVDMAVDRAYRRRWREGPFLGDVFMSDSNSSAIVGAFSRFMLSAGLSQLPSSVSPRSRRRSGTALGSARSGRRKPAFSLAEVIESLESRSMMSAATLNVAKVLWNGHAVDAVRDEYVLRMPQLNVATAKSIVDYACATPAIKAGWSLQTIGSGFFKLNTPGASQTAVLAWATQSKVKSIDVNAVSFATKTPNDPLYGDAGNWAFPKIDAPGAWDTSTGTAPTVVAVLDSGVDYTHPDLAANMWKNPNEIPANGIDDDSNGYTDDVYGINAITGSGNPMDDYGHGTFVAGLIGAVGDNAVGMAGVNWAVQIMAVKIMDSTGAVSLAAEIVGIQYVINQKLVGQNIAAANCSYGDYTYRQSQFDALDQLGQTGVVIAAAAGNDANDNDATPFYPANYAIPSLISVAATDQADALAAFSNYGATTVDLGAPGDNVLSTRFVGGSVGTPLAANPQYGIDSGTSFSAPLVAGTAALLKSIKPYASAQQIKDAILNGVDKVTALSGKVLTGGRLNVSNSVDLILSTIGAVPVASFQSGQSLQFLEGNVGYAYADVKVQLDRPCDPGKSCSVWYETRPGGSAFSSVDFVATSGFLTFSGSTVIKSFRIKIIGDRLAEAAEQFAVRLDFAKTKGATIGDAQVNITILDDDANATPVLPAPTNSGLLPLVSVSQQVDSAGAALPVIEGGNATFVVSLDRTFNKIVTVKYRTAQPVLVPLLTALEGVDYLATSGTITFAPGERTKTFAVKTIADKLNDPNETFRVVLFDPFNAQVAGSAGGGVGLTVGGAAVATITDKGYVPPSAPGFQITVTFPDSSLSTTQQAVFQQAATRWAQIIVGDLPDVVDPVTGQIIDDILITATAPAIDGAGGILGQAGPTEFRTGAKGLPYKGVMQFDSADVPTMQSDGTFSNVILHEMAHVLGFGTMWQSFGLLTGGGTATPVFTGTNAVREYNSTFATTGTGVPVENTGGQGTADGHWRESVFKTELMTGYAEPAGTSMPISRITVGQFADLGYTVNYAQADAYTKPALRGATAPASPTQRKMLFVAPPNRNQTQVLPVPAVARPVTPQQSVGKVAKPATASSVANAAFGFDPIFKQSPVIRSQPTAAGQSFFGALGRR